MAKIYENQIKEDEPIEYTPPFENNQQYLTGQNRISPGITVLDNTKVAGKVITIDQSQNIQDAINAVSDAGGGTVALGPGTFLVAQNIYIPSSITVQGVSVFSTVVDFQNTANGFIIAGSDSYSTGTITSITSNVVVTGSGTSWLANVSTQHQFFIANRWYRILSVDSDTQLTLLDAYAGNATLPGSVYRTAKVKSDITFSNLTVKNSTGTGIDVDDVRNCNFDGVYIQQCNKGATFDYCSEGRIDNLEAIANTSNGFEWTHCGFNDFEAVVSSGNGGHGVVLNDFSITAIGTSSSTSNTSDGFNITSCTNLILEVQSSLNGGQGLEFVSDNSNIVVRDGVIQANTSDGIKLTATSDDIRIIGNNISFNGGYGVNIAASSCDNTIITANSFTSNVSGAINDSGTGTKKSGNIGVDDVNQIIKTFEAKETIAVGNALYLDAARLNTNSAVLVSASSQYFSAADSASLSPTSNLTIEAWVYPDTSPASGDAYAIVGKYTQGPNDKSYLFLYNNNAGTYRLRAILSADGTNEEVFDKNITQLTEDTWTHVAMVFTAASSTVEFFINGVSQGTATGTITSIFNSATVLTIGADNQGGAPGRYWNGKMDDVRLWSTTKTAADILASYQTELDGTETSLNAYWQLDNALTDGTANGNTLTNNNAATFSTDVPFAGSSGNRVGKAEADVSGRYQSFIGFAASAASATDDVLVIIGGEVTGLSGLTAGTQYYVSDTAGAISSSAGTNTRKAGIGLSTTTLLITNIW